VRKVRAKGFRKATSDIFKQMSPEKKFAIARQLFSKLEGDIQNEDSYHEGNEGAQKALRRVEHEVDAARKKLNDLE
jgi:hypothetical protein